jgi:dihydrodipicolinate synthase/N-acetylneuraminate lyase
MKNITSASRFPKGVLPVIQVPYLDDFSIDYAVLKKEIRWLLDEGVDGLVIAMVSEVLRLAEHERHELLEKVVEYANGEAPVIASVGAESTVVMCRYARESEKRGASALMAIPPSLTRLSAVALTDYYRTLIESSSLPVIVQDASGYVGNAIPIELQASLWRQYPERVAFKPEAQPLAQNHARLMELTDGLAPVYEGTAGIGIWGGFSRGLIGTMPGSDVPWAIRKLWDLLSEGKSEQALEIHAALSALVSLMPGLDSFLAIEKRLLVEQGIFKNTKVRGPVGYTLDESTEREALATFVRLQQLCGKSRFQ